MHIQTRYAVESDASQLAQINVTSFSPSPFYRHTFADVSVSALHTLKYARALQKFTDPKTHVQVAIDPETGLVLGSTRWAIPLHYQQKPGSLCELPEDAIKMAADPEKFLPENMNKQFYALFFGMLKSMRAKYVNNDDIVLEYLAISPEQQGKGIGSQLLQWGIQKADALNARIYLEASVEGYPLYKKYGWRLLEEANLDFESLGGAGKATYLMMVRDPVAELDRTK
ncbi:acyl-CoA N-acyltransferase [Aspergillus leporis]|uniref:Acyl-CoA N-acyltransferase n=1 Tax=Aspergillus leporis TaxID=41062 RepID=A0A5N5WUR2_9EURO|nr:acyl-CoA N-acyltransferase [Aspergillus leporis]